ncbi:ABC transporter substrate-binding protein [Nocardia puris]|uniref:heme/hemin ABC transporter substrate-binding protein n=1 Tax=Nocardia puris TaxID=208602 RepID=UPI001895A335|nr:ABC transporter substrate-binding protein [Nocardia puris]MBF6210130.1 ABC transporter substrate-binding protein [Nocardia puris]MBF6368321.1 ABC transporter substrate-binding protein [Nocardia puris]MBF6457961.1 ABC transporter substrate-binding protein [Nocardia puris]
MSILPGVRSAVLRCVLAALALVLCVGVTACGGGDDAGAAQPHGPSTARVDDLDPVPIGPAPTPVLPATVRSFDGGDVTVTSADRIIASDRYGTLAQIVWALGLGDNLVGRSTSASFPAVREVPNVAGGNGALNIESILALRPTVFLTDTTTAAPAVREQLSAAGVTVVYFDPERTMEGVVPQIEAVAAALGVPDAGRALGERTRAEIDAASAGVPAHGERPRIAFLYLRSAAITMLAGPGSGADALIAAIGGEDAGTAAGLTEPFTAITSEAMITAAPDVLLVMTDGLDSLGGLDGLLKVPGIAQTPAGRNQRVVDMSDAVILSFGPNTGRVIAALGEAVYGTA